MAAGEHGSHTGGAKLGVILRQRREPSYYGFIMWITYYGPHVGAELPLIEGSHALETGPRHVKQAHRKIKFREACEPLRQVVNSIVPGGQGTVATRVGHFQFETEEHFFGGLHAHVDPAAVLDVAASAIGIHAEFGVDQIAVIRD